MLYVFHVEVGRMMNFDMTVALSSVENLKDTIERLHGIPASNIVLLVSGGEMLVQSTQVSYYSAGTDTNPIYMFLNGDPKDAKLPPAMPHMELGIDLRAQVERSLELPAKYETIVTRAQLALRMHDLAQEEQRLCENLVHEQHLQQQGWSAVVANMEDLTDEFKQRFQNFCIVFDRHLEKRSEHLELLRNFTDDQTKLSRIPILPGLMPLAEADFHGFDDFLDTDEVFSRADTQQQSVLLAEQTEMEGNVDTNEDGAEQSSNDVPLGSTNSNLISSDDKSSTSPNKKLKMGNDPSDEGGNNSQATSTSSMNVRRVSLNILQWITSKENHNALKTMSDECIQGLNTFNDDVYQKLKTEVQCIINSAEQSDVKEIKGLGDRLCKLEECKYRLKNIVKDQKELSTAFQQNQNRAINLRDPSILPDLCASHQSQLQVMLQNHNKIQELRRRIAKAKDELGLNLHFRMKHIVLIENTMSEFDNRLLFYHRCLRRAERHIHIIEQIHQAPCIYVAAVTEVVRRKIFSGEFREWASKLAEDFDSIHSEEVKRRQAFNERFEGHFLNILFPGMNDMPPAFANDNPLVFDARLPNITRADIDLLSSYLPELTPQINLPDMEPVINFFVSRSGEHQKERLEKLLREQIATALNLDTDSRLPEKALHHHRLNEIQRDATAGCEESETDTETEFEKLSANAMTTVATSTSENKCPEMLTRSMGTEPLLTQSAATLTDDNETTIRAEVDRLRGTLSSMSKLSIDCLRLTRTNLTDIRSAVDIYREDLLAELQSVTDKWNLMRMQYESQKQELSEVNEMRDKQLQMQQDMLTKQNHELEMLRQQANKMATMQMKCESMEAELMQLRDELKIAQFEKDSAVAQAREELIHDHKTEIESLRCRFRLMTSMESLPSDTSLEKLERPTSSCDYRIDMSQHEAALAQLRATLEAEKERAVTVAVEMERSLWQSRMSSESVMANVGILKEMLEDKERQLEQLREKDLILTKENYQLKTRLDALTNEEGNSWLKEKIDYLNRDKTRLEEELNMEKSRRLEMETSFAALKESHYDHGKMARIAGHKNVVLGSCTRGDIVFAIWNMRHGQFMVVQDSQSLYFVHDESLPGLNLQKPPRSDIGNEIPVPYYAIGRVVDKEYCQARKDENRYRVRRGSKFYRIKLAPLTNKLVSHCERLESGSMGISRSASHYESHSDCSFASGGGSTAIGGRLRSSNSVSECAVDYPTVGSSANKDVTDSPSTSFAARGALHIGGIKERTISITSVTEEDDEPLSLLSERCHYGSVSEENESESFVDPPAVEDVKAIATSAAQVSVITEQPTASNKYKLDLLLASADIVQSKIDENIKIESSEGAMEEIDDATAMATISPSPSPSSALIASAIAVPTQLPISTTAIVEGCSPSIPTTSEDSDEYRSLEPKDEADFPISEW